MGQAFGLPLAHKGIRPFTNLPKEALQSIWTSYNLLGEGWGLEIADFKAIFLNAPQLMSMGFTDEQLESMFVAFDTDNNGIVDALETLSVLALVSGMESIEKLQFIYSAYDFNSCNSLSFDEATLLLRSVIKGLAKVCPEQSEKLLKLDNMEKALHECVEGFIGNIFKDKVSISSGDLQAYAASHPVIHSWLTFCASFPFFAQEAAALMAAARGEPVEESKDGVSPTFPIGIELAQGPSECPRAVTYGDVSDLSTYEQAAAEADTDEQEDEADAAAEEEEKENSQEAEEGQASIEVSKVEDVGNKIQPWFDIAKQLKPEADEEPVFRNDDPEDSFEKIWVHGSSASRGTRRAAAYSSSGVLYLASEYVCALKQVSNPEDEAAPPTWSQRVFEEHNFAIVALSVSSNRRLFATADIVKADSSVTGTCQSRIVVWDAVTNTPVSSTYTGFNVGDGMRALDFSRDGKLLITLTADINNTVSIYEVESMKLIHTRPMGESAALRDVKFTGTNTVYVTAGAQGVNFGINEGTVFLPSDGHKFYEQRVGLLQGAPVDGLEATSACKFELEDECITGTASGHVLFWRGRSCIQCIKAHSTAISCLSYSPETRLLAATSLNGFVKTFKVLGAPAATTSASKSGPKLLKVRQLEQVSAFDIKHLESASTNISSFDLSACGTKAVVGTDVGDIFEISLRETLPGGAAPGEGEEEEAPPADAGEGDGDGAASSPDKPQARLGNNLHSGPIVFSTWSGASGGDGKITGLAATEGGFLTCGTDGYIRRWACAEGTTNKVLNSETCDSGCNTMAASATTVAVALDGTGNKARHGVVQLFALPDFKFISALEENKLANVGHLRFSPDGNFLVATSTLESGGGRLIVYQKAEENWAIGFEVATENPILNFDFHAENSWLRIVDTADKLHILPTVTNTDTGAIAGTFVDNPRQLRNLLAGAVWATSTVPCAWDTTGMFVGLDYSHMLRKLAENSQAGGSGEVGADGEGEATEGESKAAESSPTNPSGEGSEEEAPHAEPEPLPELVKQLGFCVRSQHLLLNTGNQNASEVKITRVPCNQDLEDPDAVVGRSSFSCHVGGTRSMVFLGEAQDRLVTVGEVDGLVMIWKVLYDMEEFEAEPTAEASEEDGEAAPDLDGFGYDSAEDEDLFDGERLTCHLARGYVRPKEGCAVEDWIVSADRGPDEVIGMHSAASYTPTDELSIEWVYGYNARQTRGTVRYDADGHIVYPAGGFGVVHQKITEAGHEGEAAQKLCMAHHDDISCMDVHLPSGLAASSHKGHGAIYVIVWKTSTQEIVGRASCGAVNGVSAIKFTPDGRCVVVACQDAQHTIKIVDWRTGHIRATGKGGPKKVLDLAISEDSTPDMLRILQVGVGHFRIQEYTNGQMQIRTKFGKYGAGNKKETILCCAPLPLGQEGGSEFVVGLSSGNFALIARGERTLSGHTQALTGGAVTALTVLRGKEASPEEPPQYKIILGCCGLQIIIYSHEMEVLLKASLTKPWGPMLDKEYKLNPVGRTRGIKSVCVDKQARKILYGTSAGEIGEIDIETAGDINDGPIVNSHFKDGLYSLMTHPIRQECLTSGEDKMLRVWDLQTHQQMSEIQLPDISRCAAYAPNGQIIVAGLGGEVRGEGRPASRDFDGKVAIISYLQGVLQIVHLTGDATETITSVTFSPGGDKLYVASLDTNIYVYDPLDSFKLVNTLKVHGEGVVSLDISFDGTKMISTGADGELVVWDLVNQSPTTLSPEEWKSLKFSTRQGTRGHNSPGVFSAYHAASTVSSLSESSDGNLLATGDVFGRVKLFNNPAVQLDSASKTYLGHTLGGVSRVAFTQEDKYVMSVGRDDRCMIQWRREKATVRSFVPKKVEAEQAEEETTAKSAPLLANFKDSFVISDVEMNNLCGQAPEEPIELPAPELRSTVGTGAHKTVAYYSGLGSVTTISGKKVATLSPDRLQQTHRNYVSASDSVGCLCVSSCSSYIAVGSAEDGGSLCVVDAHSGATLTQLRDAVLGGVIAASFSHDSRFLAVLAGDAHHTVHLFNAPRSWADANMYWSGTTSVADAKFISFLSGSSFDFVTGDAKELRWWKIAGKNVQATCVKVPADAVTVLTGVPGAGCIVTGHSDGSVMVWKGPEDVTPVNGGELNSGFSESKSNADQSTKVPLGPPITALLVDGASRLVVGSSAGIQISETSDSGTSFTVSNPRDVSIDVVTARLANSSFFDRENGGIYPTSFCSDAKGQRLLISLNVNAIVEMALDSLSTFVVSEGELPITTTAACAHPSEPNTLVTGTSGGAIKVWNLASNALEATGMLSLDKKPATAMSFIKDNTIAVGVDRSDTGGKSGAVFLIEISGAPEELPTGGRQLNGPFARKLKIVKKLHNIGKGNVTSIKLSPDGKMLACGSADGNVYLFNVANDYAPIGLAACQAGLEVADFDWSTDSAFMRCFGPAEANDTLVKLFFFAIEQGATEAPATPLKEDMDIDPIAKGSVKWATASSPGAFEAAGAHPASVPGVGAELRELPSKEELPGVYSVSVRGDSLAAGYTDGSVRVFKYPARPTECAVLNATNSAGPVRAVFLTSGSLACISDKDGTIAVYK